jgi:ABC-2 type transport system ATP-binding protein
MNEKRPLLALRGITKRFGRLEALRSVEFSVQEGEVLGLIGPNGSGKTTLLECLAGLHSVRGGEVLYRGVQLAPRQRRSVMFYVPENVVPYAEHTVRQALAFFFDVFALSENGRREVIDAMRVAPVLEKKVGQLSKGERRRLLLAIGLSSPHRILLMDEPFEGLDLRQTRDAMSALRELTARSRTLVLSIHQLADAQRVCDRFVLLSHGCVTGEGTLVELQAKAGAGGGSLEDVFLALS